MGKNFSRLFPIIISTIIFITGLLLVITSYFSYEIIEARIDIILGTTNLLTPNFLLKSRFIGIVIIIISFVSAGIIKERQQLLYKIINSSPTFFKDIINNLVKTIKEENKIHFYTLIAIITIAIVIRLYFLFQPIRYNEAFTFINYVQNSFSTLVSNYSYSYNHIFHTLLVYINYLIFGPQLWAIRLPALIFGILSIPMTYIATRIYYNKHAALLSAGLVASSSILIEYSTKATGFTITLFIFLAIFSLSKYLTNNKNSFAWLIFAILSALGFYTTPTMLFSFGLIIIWLIITVISKDTKLEQKYLIKNLLTFLIITFILTFILYTPFIIKYALGLIQPVKATKIAWPNFITTTPLFLKKMWSDWNRDMPIVASIIFATGFLISLIFHKKIANYKIPIALISIIWIISLWLVKRTIPLGSTWLFLLFIYIIPSSAGIILPLRLILSKVRKDNYKNLVFSTIVLTLSVALSIIVLVSPSIPYSNQKETLVDAEKITVTLKDQLKSDDRIITCPPSDLPLVYYFSRYDIPTDYLYADLYSSKQAYIIVNKADNQTINDVLKYNSLSLKGFSKPEISSKFNFADIYKANNLIFESKIILDFKEFIKAEFQNTKLSSDKKEIIIEKGENILKLCKIPINIKSSTNYLISFKIKKTNGLDNLINFDFFAQGYDNPEQEFHLEPERFGEDYTHIVDILNSGKVPSDTSIYFRIFTYSRGEAKIKDLKIYELPY